MPPQRLVQKVRHVMALVPPRRVPVARVFVHHGAQLFHAFLEGFGVALSQGLAPRLAELLKHPRSPVWLLLPVLRRHTRRRLPCEGVSQRYQHLVVLQDVLDDLVLDGVPWNALLSPEISRHFRPKVHSREPHAPSPRRRRRRPFAASHAKLGSLGGRWDGKMWVRFQVV